MIAIAEFGWYRQFYSHLTSLKEHVSMDKKQENTEPNTQQQEETGPRLKVRRAGLRLRSRVRAGIPDQDV